MNTDTLGKKDIPAWKVFGSAILIWFGVSALPYGYGFWHPLADYSIEQRGQLGDMFGLTNSVFSSLAFAALIYTIYLQRKDLGQQRIAFKEQLAENKRTAAAQENAEEALRGQLEMHQIAVKITTLDGLLVNSNRRLKEMAQQPESNAAYILEMEQIKDKLVVQKKELIAKLGLDIS